MGYFQPPNFCNHLDKKKSINDGLSSFLFCKGLFLLLIFLLSIHCSWRKIILTIFYVYEIKWKLIKEVKLKGKCLGLFSSFRPSHRPKDDHLWTCKQLFAPFGSEFNHANKHISQNINISSSISHHGIHDTVIDSPFLFHYFFQILCCLMLKF